jgi:outer membrane immunogenic protein
MRLITAAGTLLLSVTSLSTLASVSFAADMAAPVYKAVPPAAVHSYSWTGFYVGAHAGFGGTWLAGSGPNGSAEGILPGPIAGGQLGFNYQVMQFVAGVEGDFSWSNMRISSPISGGSVYIKDNYFATLAGRLGYSLERITVFGIALNPILIYGKGGVAFVQEDWTITSNNAAAVGTFDRHGWMVGGGVEYALWGNWSVKAEYNYYDFGTLHETLTRKNAANFIVGNVDAHSHLGKAGINFRF